jgi:DnaJ-class molecular chaperone
MLAPLLEREIAELTCTYCAGAGEVSTHVTKTFNGARFKEIGQVKDCHYCNGSGIEPPLQKGYA